MTAQVIPAAGYVLDVPVNPVPLERPRTVTEQRFGSTSSRTFTPERSEAFRTEFQQALLTVRPRPTPPGFAEPIAVTIRCWRHTRGLPGDVDNLAKAVLDAGNKVLWSDDRHVHRLHVTLEDHGTDVTGRIWLRIVPLRLEHNGIGEDINADRRYALTRKRLAELAGSEHIGPGARAKLDQYGAGVRDMLAMADVDVRDPIVERAVLRLLDVLLMPVQPNTHDAWCYLAELAAGLALNLGIDQDATP